MWGGLALIFILLTAGSFTSAAPGRRTGSNRTAEPVEPPAASSQHGCEVPRPQFVIESLGSIATELGTAGFVIDEPGDYLLAEDLEIAGTDFGILIRANHVTLDLDGHSIDEPSSQATIIQADGVEDVEIRDGKLKGGARGIVAVGTRQRSNLRIERLVIDGGASGQNVIALEIKGVHRVRVTSTVIRNADVGIAATSSFGLIADNDIETRSIGIQGGIREIRNNTIRSAMALSLDSWSVVTRNIIDGSHPASAITIAGQWNRLVDNRIEARGSTCAVRVKGHYNTLTENRISGIHQQSVCLEGIASLVEGNKMMGAMEAAVRVGHRLHRVADNVLGSGTDGIIVDGPYNLIEDNLIRGGSLDCGIRFTSGDNVHRGNRVRGPGVAVCGEPNTDGGGNLTARGVCPPAGKARECADSDLVAWDERHAHSGQDDSDRRLGPAGARSHATPKSPSCPSGDVQLISSLEWTVTPLGAAALVIDEPGYYLVTNDLTIPVERPDSFPTYGILILAKDVVLDFGNHTVDVDRGHPSSMLRVVGGHRIVLKDGNLLGGQHGVSIRADQTTELTSLTIEAMTVDSNGGSSYSALGVVGFDRVDISESYFDGVDGIAWISGKTTGRIVDNVFANSDVALDAREFDGGEVLRNVSNSPFFLGSGNSIRDNFIGEGYLSFALIVGDRNEIINNQLYSESALWMQGENLVVGNILQQGRHRGVVSERGGNRIIHNLVPMQGRPGILSEGAADLIEDNFIYNAECGISLGTSGSRYRDNVVVFSDEGVCGSVAVDGGGNVLPVATCGNGSQSTQEQCDYPDFGGQTCAGLGFDGGLLRCAVDCGALDTLLCSNCGDNAATAYESCDGTDLRGWDCRGFGYDEGVLSCKASCDGFELSGCSFACGNGMRNDDEVCDGEDLGGVTCQTQGFEGGNLACLAGCDGFDTSGCSACGNGEQEGQEVCDGGDLDGRACSDFGFGSGQLRCGETCNFFLMNACTDGCGNGVREGDEICDGADLAHQTCESIGYEGGILGCNASCDAFDITLCRL